MGVRFLIVGQGRDVENHTRFHVETGKVAIAINVNKHPEAQAMLNTGTPYFVASGAVRVGIKR